MLLPPSARIAEGVEPALLLADRQIFPDKRPFRSVDLTKGNRISERFQSIESATGSQPFLEAGIEFLSSKTWSSSLWASAHLSVPAHKPASLTRSGVAFNSNEARAPQLA